MCTTDRLLVGRGVFFQYVPGLRGGVCIPIIISRVKNRLKISTRTELHEFDTDSSVQSSISEGYNEMLLCLRPEAGYVVYVMETRRSLADLFCNNWQYLELLSKKLHASLCTRLLNCFFRNILSSAVLSVKLPTVCIPLDTRDRGEKKVRIVFSCAISLIPELNQSLGVELSKMFQLRNLAEENKQTKSKAEKGILSVSTVS